MYGIITTVPAPVEMYDGVHAEMTRRAGTSIDGLLVHVGRASTDGFEVLEVWESKEHYDRANTDIVFPLVRQLAGDQPSPFDRASNGSLRRPWACHSPRQHPALADTRPRPDATGRPLAPQPDRPQGDSSRFRPSAATRLESLPPVPALLSSSAQTSPNV
jgi:hypothetical protein